MYSLHTRLWSRLRNWNIETESRYSFVMAREGCVNCIEDKEGGKPSSQCSRAQQRHQSPSAAGRALRQWLPSSWPVRSCSLPAGMWEDQVNSQNITPRSQTFMISRLLQQALRLCEPLTKAGAGLEGSLPVCYTIVKSRL